MAYIVGQDDEENQNPQAASAPLVGGASANVGAGTGGSPGSTGAGKGGQGGFVNLQSYLGANAGDTGSTGALKETVGSQFGKESQAIQKGADDYYTSAQDQVNKSKVSTDDADKMLEDAAGQYSYSGNGGNLAYSQSVDKVKGALTGQYQGPREYNYGLGAQTQEYGNALQKDGNFDGLMKNIYSQRTPNALTQGQYNLQKQLDVSNSNLTGARDELANQYGGLQKQRDDTVTQTTEKLGGLEQDYRLSQNALRDYLTNKSTGLDTSIAQQESDARKAYEQALATGTGVKSLGYDTIANIQGNNVEIGPRAQLGVWGDNLNYSQIQKELDGFNSGALKWYTADRDPELARRSALLNSFYGEQDSKYKDVADMDEKRFNVLMDFLGSDGPRKEQGFSVRNK